MSRSPLLPSEAELRLDHVVSGHRWVTVIVVAARSSACCPVCQQASSRLHSRYFRTLADLPWQGVAVRLRLRTRKFFCDAPRCARRLFTERLPNTAGPYARRTLRLKALRLIGLVVGGEAGARLAERLGIVASGETLLRRVRQFAFAGQPTPRVLGVDDGAWKRGHRDGTILCDLERDTVVDLLPERTAEGFAAWLRQRPGVEIITRDRAGVSADGARQGAPGAVPVADRWHLLRNLAEALEGILRARHAQVREAARSAAAAMTNAPALVQPDRRPRTRAEQVRHERRERRLARYHEVVALHEQGASQAAISRQLGLGRHTVRRWRRAGAFPEWTVPQRPSALRPFLPYREQRWAEGCRNAARLWREIRQQGYTGRDGLVRQWVGLWRRQLSSEQQHAATRCATPPPKPAVPTLRRTVWLLLRAGAQDLTAGEQAFISTLGRHCPDLEQVAAAAREFVRLVRERDAGAWPGWLERARATPLARFADHLERDEAAVVAALQLPWSNGPVEGQVNRLKLIKRQAYGRAGFDLLKQRVLQQVA